MGLDKEETAESLDTPPHGKSEAPYSPGEQHSSSISEYGRAEDKAICTREHSKIVKVQHGEKECVAILPDSFLLDELRDAVISRRNMKKTELEAEELIKTIDQDFDEAQRSIQDLEASIEKEGGANNPGSTAMREELTRLQEICLNLTERKGFVDENMNENYMELHQTQIKLFEYLDVLFVKNGFMPEEGDELNEQAAESASYEKQIEGEQKADGENGIKTQNDEAAGDGVPDCAGPTLHEDPQPAEEDQDAKTQKDIEEYLRYEFETYRTALRVAEDNLERREEEFHEQRYERQYKEAAGEAVETLSEVDAREFNSTRRMTQKIIEFEAKYENAKAAALAAGVDLMDPDIESGFLDDVDDGYRLSAEETWIGAADNGRMRWWLDSLPDSFDSAEEHVDLGAKLGDVDDWGATELADWESWSTAADGRDRRRIDKWNAQAGMLGSG